MTSKLTTSDRYFALGRRSSAQRSGKRNWAPGRSSFEIPSQWLSE
jgi:hypothetical protein